MHKYLAVNGELFSETNTERFESGNSQYLVPSKTNQIPLHPVLSNYRTPLDNRFNLIVKGAFDVTIALFLSLVVLSWLIPFIALLIKLDSPGPVFFLQKRNKKNSRVFNCIKFRTMHHHSERKTITRLGRFLRYHHIDELPQLMNVLLGDMSIIGPRPHVISENLKYGKLIRRYEHRHWVKPGITGLAQSLGNFGTITNLKKVEERVGLDIEYVTGWTFEMDLKIVCRTFCLTLKGLFLKQSR